jgi:hypothetical protein
VVAPVHTSARIGDSRDVWRSGVLSHVNARATQHGIVAGEPLRVALERLVQRS